MKKLEYKISRLTGVKFFMEICSNLSQIKLELSDYDTRKKQFKDSTAGIFIPKKIEKKLSQFGAIQFCGDNEILRDGIKQPHSPSIAYMEIRFYRLALEKIGMKNILDSFRMYRDDSNEAIRFRFNELDNEKLEYIVEICKEFKRAFQNKYKDVYEQLTASEIPASINGMPR